MTTAQLLALLVLAPLVVAGVAVWFARRPLGGVKPEGPFIDAGVAFTCDACRAGRHQQCAPRPDRPRRFCTCFCQGSASRPDNLARWELPGYSRYTTDLRAAMWLAGRLQQLSGRAAIEVEHLAAAVVFTDPMSLGRKANARAALQEWGYREETLLPLEDVSAAPGSADGFEWTDRRLPAVSADVRARLAAAADLASAHKHRWIRPEHVVAALLRDAGSSAARVLGAQAIVVADILAAAVTRNPPESAPYSSTSRLLTPNRLRLPATRLIRRAAPDPPAEG